MSNNGTKVALGVLVVGAVITVIVLATRPAKAAPGLADVSGVVSDQFGYVISGVTVTLGDLETMSNTLGAFDFANVPTGSYSMSFSKSGYDTVYL